MLRATALLKNNLVSTHIKKRNLKVSLKASLKIYLTKINLFKRGLRNYFNMNYILNYLSNKISRLIALLQTVVTRLFTVVKVRVQVPMW